MTLPEGDRERALLRVLGSVSGMLQEEAMDVLLSAYVSVSRVLGRSKEEVVKRVRDYLEREASPGMWKN